MGRPFARGQLANITSVGLAGPASALSDGRRHLTGIPPLLCRKLLTEIPVDPYRKYPCLSRPAPAGPVVNITQQHLGRTVGGDPQHL